MDTFAKYLPELETEMRRLVACPADGPDLVYGMMRYHLGWVDQHFAPIGVHAGKRVRPIILLLATEALGGDWRQALPAAASLELLHNFTLIHDDIEDGDRLRRGRPTLWDVWDIPQAINAGDAMFALAYRGLLALPELGVPARHVMTAAQVYTETVVRLTEGQCRDMSFEQSERVTEAEYLAMIEGKTSALLGLSAELAAIITGAPTSSREALRDFGENLGLAFQMHDDILGLWGQTAKTGKPVGADLVKRKKTLPILHAARESAAFRELLARDHLDDTSIAAALRELEFCGSRAWVESREKHYTELALDALDRSGGTGEALTALHALAARLLSRQT